MTAWMLVALLAAPQVHCNKDNPAHCSTALAQGEVAPYAGQLLTPDLALFLGQGRQRCVAELQAQEDACREDRAVDRRAFEASQELDQDQFDVSLNRCLKQLKDSNGLLAKCDPPFYKQPWFVAPVVAVVTATATALVFNAIAR